MAKKTVFVGNKQTTKIKVYAVNKYSIVKHNKHWITSMRSACKPVLVLQHAQYQCQLHENLPMQTILKWYTVLSVFTQQGQS